MTHFSFTKTGRGIYIGTKKHKHVCKRGGYIPLLLQKGHGSGTAPAASAVNTAIADANIQGGMITAYKLKRITEKIKRIKF